MISTSKFTLNTDGGSRGNPGPGAAAAVLKNDTGTKIKQKGVFLGNCTNNEAEYKALIMGLEMTLEEGIQIVDCLLDSELVVKQVRGEYKIKLDHLKKLAGEVKKLEAKFTKVTYNHVPRSQNKDADALVNEVLDNA